MLGVGNVLLILRVFVQQTLHFSTLDDVLVDNLAAILGFHLGVECVVGQNLDDGAFFTETETSGGDHLDVVRQVLLN